MEKYNKLTIIEEIEPIIRLTSKRKVKTRMVKCLCDCGNEKILSLSHLKSGNTKSCGCFNIENIIKRNTKHNHMIRGKRTSEYITWSNMIQRCTNPNNTKYSIYGGRGIKICDKWRNSFIEFLKDMGKRPNGLSIERINVNGDYEPSNCKWASSKEQANNRRKKTI
jgi:hypothetical protein